MRYAPWVALLLAFVPVSSSALELRWISGASELSFSSATRCTLVVQAGPNEGRLPPEWRLLCAADSCEILPVPAPPGASCQEAVAQVSSLSGPADVADVLGGVRTAHFCSAGGRAASTAWFVIDLPAWGKGTLKAVALDPTDPDSVRVLQSSVVKFNGGASGPLPPALLRTATAHHSTAFEFNAVGVA